MLLATSLALPLVLRLAVCNGLPLHIFGRIGAATGLRLDVVDYIALAWPLPVARDGAGVLLLELDLGALAALGASICDRG